MDSPLHALRPRLAYSAAILMAALLGLLIVFSALPSTAQSEAKSTFRYAYLPALSGYRYQDLIENPARVYLVDVDDSHLTPVQIQHLKRRGSLVISYLSIGEAETYRSYWRDWKVGNPGFILPENPKWPGNHLVKFWDPQWQNIIFTRAKGLAQRGYDGMYLDIVDGYQHPQVVAAFPGDKAALRAAMQRFVMALSQQTKAINPDFRVIPQNALELLGTPQSAHQPNQAYLNAIDGVGVESLWYDDNRISGWTKWDLEYIQTAQKAGKFVLAISYPTQETLQNDYITKATKAGIIPFLGRRLLSQTEPHYPLNEQILQKMPMNWQKPLR